MPGREANNGLKKDEASNDWHGMLWSGTNRIVALGLAAPSMPFQGHQPALPSSFLPVLFADASYAHLVTTVGSIDRPLTFMGGCLDYKVLNLNQVKICVTCPGFSFEPTVYRTTQREEQCLSFYRHLSKSPFYKSCALYC